MMNDDGVSDLMKWVLSGLVGALLASEARGSMVYDDDSGVIKLEIVSDASG